MYLFFFFFSSRRRHTRSLCDWSSDVCSSDLATQAGFERLGDLDLEIGIANIERRSRIMGTAREQLRRFRRALHVLRRQAGGEVPGRFWITPTLALLGVKSRLRGLT